MSDDESSQNSAGPPSPQFRPSAESDEDDESQSGEVDLVTWFIIPGQQEDYGIAYQVQLAGPGRYTKPEEFDNFIEAITFVATTIHNTAQSRPSGVVILHRRVVTCEVTVPPTYHDITGMFNDPDDLAKLV